jgi:hypothetical protein
MIQKLLINGCSMIAGDAITWDMHHPDIDWDEHIKVTGKKHNIYSSQEIEDMRIEYSFKLRLLDNLSGQLNKITGLPVTDLSVDGNSNQNICMTTISFLSKLSVEERKNYHVCIGWTEPSRRIKWNTEINEFINLNMHSKYYLYEDYIKEVMLKAHKMDDLMNYFHNVIALQSYLQLNNITYTFWNSLPPIKNVTNFNIDPNIIQYPSDLLFNKKDWLLFNYTEQPWHDDCWLSHINKPTYWISIKNAHPNLETVIEFSKKLATHINKVNI